MTVEAGIAMAERDSQQLLDSGGPTGVPSAVWKSAIALGNACWFA